MSLDLLKKILKEKKVVFGTDRTIKKLKRGVCQKVFLSSNCPKETEEDIRYYSKLAKAEVIKLDQPNDELGMVCKKPFSVSVLCC